MQKQLRERAIASKKEFLKEIIKELRVSGKEITLTYRLLLAPPSISKKDDEKRIFTLFKMVVAVGLEPTTSRM